MQSINVEVLAGDREDKSSVLLLTFRTGWSLPPPPSPCLLCLIWTVCQPLHGVPLDEVSLELGRRIMSLEGMLLELILNLDLGALH